MEKCMRDRNRSFLTVLETYFDMVINIASIYIAYVFLILIVEPTVDIASPFTIVGIMVTVFLSSFCYQWLNLYHPVVRQKRYSVSFEIIRTNILFFGALALIAAVAVKDEVADFSVFWILMSGFISSAFLIFKRHIMRDIARLLFKKQFNLRKIIIIGDNAAAMREYLKQVNSNEQTGIMILGYIGKELDEDIGCDRIGAIADLTAILDEYRPSDVVFAVAAYNKNALINAVNACDDRCIKVYFLPTIYGFFKSSKQIEQFGSLPLVNIHTTPLDNPVNAFIKRMIDIVGSLALILLTWPLMVFAAIGIRITSPGPVLFKQKRVGKMGKPFIMLKFRSMHANTSTTDWTTSNDPRKTKFGAILRRYAIDELPQLFNVLFGSMSLVGPRPEIPEFVENFKNVIPLYMVKHYVKPGMTGLAQIKGLRGDTSVEDRIHEDISYIENWSLGLDLAILLRTPFKAVNKSETYVASPEERFVADENGDPFDRPKRILYLASTYEHIERFHLPYIEELRATGAEVYTMARGENADYDIPFKKSLFALANLRAIHKIRQALKSKKFDLCIANTTLASVCLRLACPKKNRPRIVNVVHGYLFSDKGFSPKSKILSLAERILKKKTDTVIVMNEEDREIAEKRALTGGEIKLIRGMGAKRREKEKSRDAVRQELGAMGKYVLIFVGEFSGRKNQEFLIRSMPKIKEQIPSAVLWLVGVGDKEEKCRKTAMKLGVSEDVIFLGHQDNPSDYIAAADLYVSASKSEGLPFNILEALAEGKTAVASRVKGHSDIIEDGASGFLFLPGDTSDFVSAVADVCSGKRAADAEAISARFHHYSFESVFEETCQALCDEIV